MPSYNKRSETININLIFFFLNQAIKSHSYSTPSSEMATKPSGLIRNLNFSPTLHLGEFIIFNSLICPFLHNYMLSSMFSSHEGPKAGIKLPPVEKLRLPSTLSEAWLIRRTETLLILAIHLRRLTNSACFRLFYRLSCSILKFSKQEFMRP